MMSSRNLSGESESLEGVVGTVALLLILSTDSCLLVFRRFGVSSHNLVKRQDSSFLTDQENNDASKSARLQC